MTRYEAARSLAKAIVQSGVCPSFRTLLLYVRDETGQPERKARSKSREPIYVYEGREYALIHGGAWLVVPPVRGKTDHVVLY